MNFKIWLESQRSPFVYHVTYYRNLDSISDDSLNYGDYGGVNFPQTWLSAHSTKGNFFVTNIQDVGHWVHTLEYHAYDKSDNVEEDGLIPIILSFRLNPNKHLPDEHGDTQSDRLTDREIPAQGIYVWDGDKWLPISYWQQINIEKFLDRDEHGVQIKSPYPLPK
jgi:hypothetical protein